ncbi:MAG: glycosyltransferase family 9 protein [Planctomycetota bacterium]|nr:MAG: glycosyltransferase family 9 protein [Planctomycetota bacterium]
MAPIHILVILPRWVGDFVMATPMLRALQNHFGSKARISGVCKPLFADLLEGTSWLDKIVFYDRRSRDPANRFTAVARKLRDDRADIALIVPNSLSTAALAFAGGAKRRVGYSRHWRRLLLTDPLAPPRQGFRIEPASPAGQAMDLAAHIGVPRMPLTLELATTSADERLTDGILGRLFPGSMTDGQCVSGSPLIVLNDNGAYGPAKAWGHLKCAQLARFTLDRFPTARVLVHCGPGDRDEARSVVAFANHPAVQSLADEPELPFGLSKAVLRRAAVLVTSDSGPRHIAAAFQTPTVVLLGPIDPRLSRSDQRHLVEMRLDLSCSPCGKRICPLKHRDCMRLQTVEDVGKAVVQLLEHTWLQNA